MFSSSPSLFRIAPLLTVAALVANVSSGNEDKYEKFEKKVAAAQKVADQAVKRGDAQGIATAYYRLANVRSEARRNDVVCDVAYLSDLVGDLQTTVDHSTWFQKNLTTLPVYRAHSMETLSLHLMAGGLIKGKTLTTAQFARIVKNAVETSTFELHKPVPGVLPLGSITFSKNTAVDHSIEWKQDGDIEHVDSPKLPASVSIVQGRVTLFINGRAAYVFQIFRGDSEVLNSVRSTDDIRIQGLDETGTPSEEFHDKLFLTPDECSA